MDSTRRLVSVATLAAALVLIVGLRLAVAGAGEAPDADLPRLPTVEERFEAAYDDEGCLRTAIDEADCSVTADELDDTLAGDEVDDVRQLRGFSGSGWTDDLSADRAVVLEDSIRRSGDDNLRLEGLVRNETDESMAGIEVTATIRDDSGQVTNVLTAPAMVANIRSGEPAPFVLDGPAPSGVIATIDWSASAVDAAPVSRDFEWQPYWELPAGLRDPVENHLYTETGSGPHPLVLFGSVQNYGPAVDDVSVTTAWLDERGAVLAIVTTPVVDSAGSPLASLAEGGGGDALLTAPGLPAGAPSLTWVSAS